MTRGLEQEIIDASAKTVAVPFFAAEFEFDSPNALYLWSGVGDLVVGGTTYTGAGQLLNVSDIRESADVAANGATVTLSGVPSDLLSLAITEDYQGRIARLKFGLIDYGLIDEMYLGIDSGEVLDVGGGDFLDLRVTQPASMFDLFVGTMDQMNISSDGETSTISTSIESKLIDLERPRVRRYTDKNQQSRFSGDLAFEFVNRIQDEDLTWGT